MSNENPVFGQEPYEWHYGRDNERVLKLYPLSMASQIRLTTVVTGVIQQIIAASASVGGSTVDDIVFMQSLASEVGNHFIDIAAVVTGKDKNDPVIQELPEQVTNMQLMTFVNHLWEVNYGSVRKNFDSLFTLAKSLKK